MSSLCQWRYWHFSRQHFCKFLSNLANDYGDAVKGTDNDQRLGPMRAIQSGDVSLKDMKSAIIINIALTIASGLVLVIYALDSLQSILAFIGLGVLAIVAAIAYTVGNKPYGYVGLGDISVFIFFGLLGVAGTYFLHTGIVVSSLILPAVGCGLLAVAVLNINNMRDIENDEECGKRTVAVRLGQQKKQSNTTLCYWVAVYLPLSFIYCYNLVRYGLAYLFTQRARCIQAWKSRVAGRPTSPNCAYDANRS
ncbi:1,4-dihydroxy-2-naphthoate octaprenyltransferase [Vibrio sinaloensis]|nr:1,4-dihydroxy-2-naphthoate octaprenyltransferase [Vibrio sinaloensis]